VDGEKKTAAGSLNETGGAALCGEIVEDTG